MFTKAKSQGQLFPHKISDLVSDNRFAISSPELIIFTNRNFIQAVTISVVDYHGKNIPDLALGTGMGDLVVPDELLSTLEARWKKRYEDGMK